MPGIPERIMQKVKAFRSAKYLAWVKTLPCCSCGAPADDAHHLIGVGNMGGMGMKAPDSMTMPVCRACHGDIHRLPILQSDQWEWIARTLAKAFDEGILSA